MPGERSLLERTGVTEERGNVGAEGKKAQSEMLGERMNSEVRVREFIR